MKYPLFTRIVSVLLALVLAIGYAVPVNAAETAAADEQLQMLEFEQTDNISGVVDEQFVINAEDAVDTPLNADAYADDEIVRVSVVLEGKSTLDAGFSTLEIASNAQAMSYRNGLLLQQDVVTTRIESALDSDLDIRWNLTLAANIISMNVAYGQIETIKSVAGVQDVVLEAQYEPYELEQEETAQPNSVISTEMIGSSVAYAEGYTGAGSRVAIIDTGLDMDHETFSAAAYEYSLGLQAAEEGMTLEAYMEKLNVLTAEEIQELLPLLNVSDRLSNPTGATLYKTSKVAFGFNYIDNSAVYIDHNSSADAAGGHGSHVAGIAAANAYLDNGDGTFSKALEKVFVQGVAPDAQVLIMKVFGKAGGAYDSDYMAAVEDAIILGCDSVNLSLGSISPGFTRNSVYAELLESLTESDTVVAIAAGNNGHWADAVSTENPGYLYAEDVSTITLGSPGSNTNALTVASVDNDGTISGYVTVNGQKMLYNETDYGQNKMTTMAGEHEYIFIDGIGDYMEWVDIGDDLIGKIAICSRGEISFSDKAGNAVYCGASATIIYNTEPGMLNMDLTDYSQGFGFTEPAVFISQADGAAIKAASTPVKDDNGNILYYTGKMTVNEGMTPGMYNSEYYTMSDFSSWGVPGTLEMKPEITAPGGNIYSLDGTVDGGTSYVTMSGTSMATPQVTGMAALVGQYIRENGLETKTGLTQRALAQSLLMSTAKALEEGEGVYYSILQQGAGLADVGAAVTADSYILMNADATDSYADGKVKVELGDDPNRSGSYTFGFSLNNLKDTRQQYMLSAEMFTQGLLTVGENTYMDVSTAAMQANVTWTVNGKTLIPAKDVSGYDFNGDGLVNSADVQALLDYATGARAEITNAELADLDADNDIDSYDAYLLLDTLNTGLVTLEPNSKVEIQVTVALTEEQKAALNDGFENGAYVEGFVFVKQLSTAEGVEGTCHSIPVLGFYGNWSDASMYDQGTLTERLYGEAKTPYLALEDTNYLALRYTDGTSTYFTGNPYGVEDEYPAGKEAINLRTSIINQTVSLIRPTASLTLMVTNQDGEYLFFGDPYEQQVPAFFYYVMWYSVSGSYTLYMTPEELGAKDGDTLNVTFLAVPEYYEVDGALTAEQLKELMEKDALGDGAYMTTTLTVDSQAPEAVSIMKDLPTGNLVVKAKDNQYVAAVQVQTKGGKVLATGIAQQSEAGEPCEVVVDLSGVKVGEECVVVIGDYAKNETAYTVTYGGEPVDYTGRMFGYTTSYMRPTVFPSLEPARWLEITPDEVWYYSDRAFGGTENLDQMDVDITAAEYIDGYVFMAGNDGYLYLAEQGSWCDTIKLGRYDHLTTEIKDMAFNYANKKLYALSADNIIYELDILSGEMTKVTEVTITNPRSSSKSFKKLTMMTIDDEGNFYLVNYGTMYTSFLYKFTLDQVVDGKITDLAPVNNTREGTLGFYTYYGSLAWDHDNDILYLATGSSVQGNHLSNLTTVNLETGAATKVTTNSGGYASEYASRLQVTVRGLYIVPAAGEDIVKPSQLATSVAFGRTEVNGLVGMEFALEPEVYPWNLADKSVTWATSNENVAVVDQNGTVTLVGLGEANVTITTNAAPNLTATCKITVTDLPNIQLSGLVTDDDGNAYWADIETDNPEQWKSVSAAGKYQAGTISDRTLYVHDGSNLYGVDAERYAVTDYGTLNETLVWTDAAPAPYFEGGVFGDVSGYTYGNTIFGGFVCVCEDGESIGLVNPETGYVKGFVMTRTLVGTNTKMAAIAYAGSGISDYTEAGKTMPYENCPTHWYYVLTENGTLYEARLFTFDSGINSTFVMEELGSTNLELTGVSSMGNGRGLSMVYDQDSGYLLLTARVNGSTTKLYAINPENQYYSVLGNFGEGVYPVTTLYQYDRINTLTVELNDTEKSVFAGQTAQLTGRVLPLSYENQLTWSSADESIATVDENGVVTAIKSGTVLITATSVAADENGNHASASCTVTVKDLSELGIKVNAQVVTDQGPKWASIDLSTLNVSVTANATTALNGAGAYNGKIYGAASDFDVTGQVYMIDPANNYAETEGAEVEGWFSFVDMTGVPAKTVTTDDGEEYTAFGAPVFLSWWGLMGMMPDYTNADEMIFSWMPYEDFGAIAYMGNSTYLDDDWFRDEDNVVYETAVFYVLESDGSLYRSDWWVKEADKYSLTYQYIGNIGYYFEDHSKLTMTYLNNDTWQGLIIGYGTDNGAELYYVDLSGDELNTIKFGTIAGVTGIEGLYFDADLSVAGVLPGITSSNSVTVPMSTATSMEEVLASRPESLTADQSVGGLNTTTTTPNAVSKPENDCGTGKTTLTLTADEASTNGIITVEYDAEKLTLESVSSSVAFKSVVDEAGKLTFGYVNDTAVTDIAVLTFTVKEETAVTVTTKEENAAKPGTSVNVTLTKPVHDYKITDSKAPACTEDGYNTYTCTACGDSYTETVDATGHYHEAYVTAPTCTDMGYTTYTCTACGHSYVDDLTPALGHDYEAVVTPPTCTSAGYTTYTCTVCGDSYTDDVTDPVAHDYEKVVTEPTCTDMGYTTYTCACGHSYVDDLTPALGHDYEAVVTAPTCTSAGYTTYTCTVCGDSYTDDVTDPIDHDYDEVVTEPTCTEYGYTSYICNYCGNSYVADYTPATGHSFGEWIVTTAPTCTEAGVETSYCEDCDAYETRETEPYCPAADYTDVPLDAWYHDAVDYVVDAGLMNGMSETVFAPNGTTTRAQLVTVLYRLAGAPSVEGLTNPFADVAADAWYADAVIWAADAGIVKGVSATVFAPNANISREQFVTILYRFSGETEVDTTVLEDYTDASSINSYAVDAFAWAVENGIIEGVTDTTLVPQGNATRAQTATILMRFVELGE